MQWLNELPELFYLGNPLIVKTVPKTDFWRTTHYGSIGHIHTGKQRYRCRQCGYRFVKHPTDSRIGQPTPNSLPNDIRMQIKLVNPPCFFRL